MSFSDKLKELRKQRGLTQAQLIEATGLSKSTVETLETNRRQPGRKTIEALSEYFDIPSDFFFDKPDNNKIPLLGDIACGKPILAEDNIQCYITPLFNVNADFALRCKGDSMTSARINNGDVVYIRQQNQVENGEIAAVLIDNEATLKKVYLRDNRIVLQPANPNYEPLVYANHDLEKIKILGKAVAFSSMI